MSPLSITSLFNNKTINLNCETLGDILKIPNAGRTVFDYDIESFIYPNGHSSASANVFLHSDPSPKSMESVKSADLREYNRLFGNMLNWSICSKTMRGEFRGCLKLVIYLVLNKIEVNLPKLLLSQMIAFTKVHGNLGFGMIICMILTHHNLSISRFSPVKRAVFNVDRMKKMHISSSCARPPFDSEDRPPSPPPSEHRVSPPPPSDPLPSDHPPQPSFDEPVPPAQPDFPSSSDQLFLELLSEVRACRLEISDLKERVITSETRILSAIRALAPTAPTVSAPPSDTVHIDPSDDLPSSSEPHIDVSASVPDPAPSVPSVDPPISSDPPVSVSVPIVTSRPSVRDSSLDTVVPISDVWSSLLSHLRGSGSSSPIIHRTRDDDATRDGQ